MSRIETILVPIDFGRPSEHALAYAIDLATQVGASVHVITTYQLPIASFPDGALVASAEMVSRLIEGSQASLERAVTPYKDGKVPLTWHLEQGDPRETILAVAKDRNASMIVMGTHGRRGIARALMGSTTESVIRTSEIPVVTVH